MNYEQFIQLVKDKKIWWGPIAYFNREHIENNGLWIIVESIDHYGNFVVKEYGHGYNNSGGWEFATGLFNPETSYDHGEYWHIIEDTNMDQYYHKVHIQNYNAALDNVKDLITSSKVTIGENGHLTLKQGKKENE